MFETKCCYPDGTPCEGKLSCTVWSGGKSGDCLKGLPITILPREELVFLLEQDRPLEQMSKAWMEHRNVDVGETFQSLLTGLYAERQHDMDMKM